MDGMARWGKQEKALHPPRRRGDAIRRLAWNVGLWWAIATFGVIAAVSAQVLPFELIGLDRGLPQSQVGCVEQDHEGYIWVGTWGGLGRYNGKSFTTFDVQNGLPSGRIWDLLADRQGRLWVATVSGMALWTDHTMRIPDEPLFRGTHCWRLAEDAEGGIWTGSDRGLVSYFQDSFAREPLPVADEEIRFHDLEADRDGVLVVCTSGLFFCRRGGHAESLTGPPVPPDSYRAVIRTEEGLWLGTWSHGLWLEKAGAWSLIPLSGPAVFPVFRLYTDRQGVLYVCTQNDGIYLKQPGDTTFQHWGVENGLPAASVEAVREDREGNLWIGMDIGGLARLGGRSFINYGTAAGLPDNCVFGISEGPSPGTIWVSTTRGAALLEPDPKPRVLDIIDTSQGLENEWILQAIQSPRGELCLLTDLRVCIRPPGGGKLSLVPEEFRFPDGSTYNISFDSAGRLWLAGEDPRGGLVVRDEKGTWHRISERSEGKSLARCRRVTSARSGGVWVCTEDQVLIRCEGTTVQTVSETMPLPSRAAIGALLEDSRGQVWVGNEGGLAVRTPEGTWELMNDTPGFTNHHVFFIGESHDGTMWIGTARGVFRFPPAGPVEFLSQRDGLASSETNGFGFFCDGRGQVWIGSIGGLSRFDPSLLHRNTSPPQLMVEEAVFRSGTVVFPRSLSLDWQDRDITFKVALLTYRATDRAGYRARLAGFDESWLPLRSETELRYTNLPAGDHVLFLQPVNESGIAGDTVRLPLRVFPPFWSTWWFRTIAVLLVIAMLLAMHRWRMHRLEQRAVSLEKTVDERTQELRAEKDRSEIARREAEEASRTKGILLARLEDAQAKIESLQQSSGEAFRDLPSWSRSVARDVATMIGASSIEIWLLKDGEAEPLSGEVTRPPADHVLETISRSREPLSIEDGTIFPVCGLTGEVLGFLTVAGLPALGSAETRLLVTLARQLGETLELQHMKAEVTQARESRALRRKMLEQDQVELLRLCPKCRACFGKTPELCPVDGVPLIEDVGELPLVLRERYRLEKLLGEGGMGRVFAARDGRLDRDVAIKILRAEHFGKPAMRFRFEQEAKTVARIQCQNVVALFDSGELDDGSAFLVMERLRGEDLKTLLMVHGPGSLRQVGLLVRHVGAGLGAAHRLGLVHRDIKPANIFLLDFDRSFIAKILDFGIAKPMEFVSTLTQTGTLVGTPAYMAPEQLQNKTLDARTDLYAFASVVYEALTNQSLVSSRHIAEICNEVLYREPAAPSTFRPGIPADVELMLRQALAKDQALRPNNTEEWSQGLATLLENARDDCPGWPSPLTANLVLPTGQQAGTAEQTAPFLP